MVERDRLKASTDEIRLQYEEQLAHLRKEIDDNKASLNEISKSKGTEIQSLISKFTSQQNQLEDIVKVSIPLLLS